MQLAISDHALIFISHKAHYQRTGPRIIKTRQMRNLHKANFLRDIQQKAWSNNDTLDDPNEMWSAWNEGYAKGIYRQTFTT